MPARDTNPPLLVVQGLLCGNSSEKAPWYGKRPWRTRWPEHRCCFSCVRARGGSLPSKEGRKWLRQFYGRPGSLALSAGKPSIPTKFLGLGGNTLGFGRGECQFYFYGRGDCSDTREMTSVLYSPRKAPEISGRISEKISRTSFF